ncbi:MAG TPA: TIGR03435 family protein [Acidobacteriaceae bacterium]|nr:TIGR03435 family protein [Acidobacteriaceae bacterium]
MMKRLPPVLCSLSLCTLPAVFSAHVQYIARKPPQTAAMTAPLPVFDVVSIRENKTGSYSSTVRWVGDAFTATNMTLSTLLLNAYNIREDLMSGLPSWADSTHFDVNAKVSDPDPNVLKNLSREQRRAMIVAFLSDRFHLRAHIETKTLPVYDLVIAKGGLRMKEYAAVVSPGGGDGNPANKKPGSMTIRNYQITAFGIPTSNLAANLAFIVQRNVIDKTGLTGMYDINLKWRPDDAPASDDNNAPDLFTALQEQLGLKLEPSKGPVNILVIDHVEMPTAN